MTTKKQKDYHGHRNRLRKRFLKNGLQSFPDYEAVEFLLTLAIPRGDVKPQAKEALRRFKTFRGVLDAPLEDLRQIPGLSEAPSAAIRFVKEAAARYLQQKTTQGPSLKSSQAVVDYCRASMGAEANEQFRVIFLNKRARILGEETIAKGTIDESAVYPRRIMEEALIRKATSLLLVHNHPSGEVSPSSQDKALTRMLQLAGKTLGMEIFDHLIVSKDAAFSFKQEGLL